MQIAIDGPVGSGKSTLAKRLAEKLGFIYIDTGATYRAAAKNAELRCCPLDDEHKVRESLERISLEVKHINGVQRVLLNGKDITESLRTSEAGLRASQISAYPFVREKMVDLQRSLAQSQNVVMDGRDIGSHVLPHADFKFYLDSNVEVRAARRCEELSSLGLPFVYEDILASVIKRDHDDMTREFSPLVRADDAIYIDSSKLNPDEVLELVYRMVKQ